MYYLMFWGYFPSPLSFSGGCSVSSVWYQYNVQIHMKTKLDFFSSLTNWLWGKSPGGYRHGLRENGQYKRSWGQWNLRHLLMQVTCTFWVCLSPVSYVPRPMIDYCWAWPTLWLSRSDNIWFTMEVQATWPPVFLKLGIQTSPRSISKLFLKRRIIIWRNRQIVYQIQEDSAVIFLLVFPKVSILFVMEISRIIVGSAGS